MELEKKTFVLVGGTGGIGFVFAQQLLKNGIEVSQLNIKCNNPILAIVAVSILKFIEFILENRYIRFGRST